MLIGHYLKDIFDSVGHLKLKVIFLVRLKAVMSASRGKFILTYMLRVGEIERGEAANILRLDRRSSLDWYRSIELNLSFSAN